jgi:hypothetical protein
MSKQNIFILSALGGAVLGVILANFLTTERGRQLLANAGQAIKDLSGQATQLAKQNIGEVLQETKNTLGNVVKDKIAEKVNTAK